VRVLNIQYHTNHEARAKIHAKLSKTKEVRGVTIMPWITKEQAINLEANDVALDKLTAQFDAVIDAIDDVLSIFRSGADEDIKLTRIEDVLSSAVSEAARLERVRR
jgi:hypothetical protein